MALLQGTVSVVETGRKVAGLTATFLRTDGGSKSLRLGSVATDSEGRFQLEIDVIDGGWDLVLVLSVEGAKRVELYRQLRARAAVSVGMGEGEEGSPLRKVAHFVRGGWSRWPITSDRGEPLVP